MYRIAVYKEETTISSYHERQFPEKSPSNFLNEFYLEDISSYSLNSLILFVINTYTSSDQEHKYSSIKVSHIQLPLGERKYLIQIQWQFLGNSVYPPSSGITQIINLYITKVEIKKDLGDPNYYLTHENSLLRDFAKKLLNKTNEISS